MRGLCPNRWGIVLEQEWLADSRRQASVGSALRSMTKKYDEGLQDRAHGAGSVKASKSNSEGCVARVIHRQKGYLDKLLADTG